MRRQLWFSGLLAVALLALWSSATPRSFALRTAGIHLAASAGWRQISATGGQPAVALAIGQEMTPRVYAGTVTSTLDGGLYVSADGGDSWAAGPPLPIAAAATSPITPGVAYVGGALGDLMQSADGVTWSALNNGLDAMAVYAILSAADGALYAGADNGVFMSADAGQTWFPTGPGIPPGAVVQALAQDGDVIIAGTDMGAFRSLDGGESWLDANDGLNALSIHALLTSGRVLHAATEAGVFTSATQGATWAPAGAGLPDGAVTALAASRRVPRVLAASVAGSLFVSADHGATWHASSASGLSTAVNALAAAGGYPSESLFAATDTGVWKLTSLFELGCAALPDAAFGADPATLDSADLAAAAARWHEPANPTFDLDEDGRQTIIDVMRSAAVFGATCPGSFSGLARAVGPTKPTLTVHVPPGPQPPDGVIDVAITISGAANLGAFEFDVTYDPAQVEVVNVTTSDLLGRTTACDPQVDRCAVALAPLDRPGAASVGVFSYGAGAGVSGDGTLAVIRLRPTARGGPAALRLEHVLLADDAANSITPTVQDATLLVMSRIYAPIVLRK